MDHFVASVETPRVVTKLPDVAPYVLSIAMKGDTSPHNPWSHPPPTHSLSLSVSLSIALYRYSSYADLRCILMTSCVPQAQSQCRWRLGLTSTFRTSLGLPTGLSALLSDRKHSSFTKLCRKSCRRFSNGRSSCSGSFM